MFKTKPWEFTDVYNELTDTKRFRSNKWFESGRIGEGRIDVEGKNFVDVFLVAPLLRGTRFVNCDFTASRIVGGFLEESELVECFFNRANLDNSEFNGALIKDCQIIATTYIRLGRFNNAKIEGGNFSQSHFGESTWNGAVVKNVNFEQANFPRGKFHCTHLINCNFRYANFFAADFKDTTFENCDFRDTHIERGKLDNTTFKNCGFYGCLGNPRIQGECHINAPDISPDFDGSKIVQQQELFSLWKTDNSTPQNDNLTEQDRPSTIIGKSSLVDSLIHLPRAKQIGQRQWVKDGCIGSKVINLEGKNFSRAFFSGGYFQSASFKNCDFTLADLRRANFQESLTTKCDFDLAMLMDLKANGALFKNCNFRQLIADRSNFEETKLVGGDWSNSEIYKGIWYAVEANGTRFINTNWFKTNWYEGHFANCDFTDAKLWRAEGEKAVFENCNFQNVEFWEFEAKDALFKNCDFRRSNLNLLRMENTIFENCGFYNCQNVPYCYFEADLTSVVINSDFSPDFDGSKVVQTQSVKQFCDLLTQFQQQGWKNSSELMENSADETAQLSEEKPTAPLEEDELKNIKLQLADVEKKIKNLNQRIKNVSGGKLTGELNRNNALISRRKELEKEQRAQRVAKQKLEREIAELENSQN